MNFTMALCMLLISVNAQAALNKWVDAEGKVHYSDTAPSNVKAQKLKNLGAPEAAIPASGVAAPKSAAERESEWKKEQKSKEETTQKAAKEQEAAQVKQKNCEIARNNLAVYENSPNVVTYNAQGERNYLDENARSQKIEDARKDVNTHCN